MEKFLQPLQEFGAVTRADYFDAALMPNEDLRNEVGMNNDDIDRFRKALVECSPVDVEEFLCKADLATYLPKFIDFGMGDLDDALECEDHTLVSMMEKTDVKKFKNAVNAFTNSATKVRRISVTLAMNDDDASTDEETHELIQQLSTQVGANSMQEQSFLAQQQQIMDNLAKAQNKPVYRKSQSIEASGGGGGGQPGMRRASRTDISRPGTRPPLQRAQSDITGGSSNKTVPLRNLRKSMAKMTGMRGVVSGKPVDQSAEDTNQNGEVEFKCTVKGPQLGIALTNSKETACLLVDMVLFGGPAEMAGLKAGDRIVSINGDASFAYMPVPIVVQKLKRDGQTTCPVNTFVVKRFPNTTYISSSQVNSPNMGSRNTTNNSMSPPISPIRSFPPPAPVPPPQHHQPVSPTPAQQSVPPQHQEVIQFMARVGLGQYSRRIIEFGFENLSDLLDTSLVDSMDFTEIGMTDVECAMLKNEIYLHLKPQSLSSPTPQPLPQVDSSAQGPKAVRKFLESAGLAQFASRITLFGVVSMEDLVNPSILSDIDLAVEVGMNGDQVAVFRKHSAALIEPTPPPKRVTRPSPTTKVGSRYIEDI
mmetsp:Transcript_47912/g.61426  ORF Transcript_47912/g.61426 Transcript_47912/m.61426 type:complete len:591 (+) Transcript_47912:17-1789(+)